MYSSTFYSLALKIHEANKQLIIHCCIVFPTVVFLHRGRAFTYQGPLVYEDLHSFLTSGYKLYKSRPTPPPLGYFGEIIKVYSRIFSQALEEVPKGQWFTLNVFVAVMPLLLVAVILAGCLLPPLEPPPHVQSRPHAD